MGEFILAYIEKRETQDGTISYRVQIRLRGYPTQTATFNRITDAKKWAAQTEVAIREGRHFKTAEAKKHTMADLIDRYIVIAEGKLTHWGCGHWVNFRSAPTTC